MFTSRRPQGGGFGRGAPSYRWKRGRRKLALLVLGIASMLPSGCASFGNPCGGGLLSNCNLFNGGLFRRNTVVAAPLVTDTCGEPFLSVPVDAAPAFGAPLEVIPAPAAPVDVLEGDPLTPIPAPAVGTSPTSGLSTPTQSNQRTLYETLKPPGGTTTSRQSDPQRDQGALTSTPTSSDAVAPLLNLPPLPVFTAPTPTTRRSARRSRGARTTPTWPSTRARARRAAHPSRRRSTSFRRAPPTPGPSASRRGSGGSRWSRRSSRAAACRTRPAGRSSPRRATARSWTSASAARSPRATTPRRTMRAPLRRAAGHTRDDRRRPPETVRARDLHVRRPPAVLLRR